MEQLLYERPREKLRNRGIESLSFIELIQLIIGSGTARIPGARLAREVELCIHKAGPSYDTLTTIPGIGDAKACQLLAALEIGRRLYEL